MSRFKFIYSLVFFLHLNQFAVLLNIFEEHLDFYKDYENYQQAKINICKYQKRGDWFIKCFRKSFDTTPHKFKMQFRRARQIDSNAKKIPGNK